MEKAVCQYFVSIRLSFSGLSYGGGSLSIFCTHSSASITFMQQLFVTTAPPPTEKGGDYEFSAFSALHKTHSQGANWRSKLCSLTCP